SRRKEFTHLGEFLSFRTFGYCANRIYTRRSLTGLGKNKLCDRPAVVHRIRVRHAAYRGETSGSRRGRTRSDGLLVFKSRLAQMHMHVDETAHNPSLVHINDASAVCRDRTRLPEFRDPAFGHEDIELLVYAIRRIDDSSVFYKNIHN